MAIDHFQIRNGAGSDSLLVAKVFHKMKDIYFDDIIEEEKYSGCLRGLLPMPKVGHTVANNGIVSLNNNRVVSNSNEAIQRLLQAASKKLHG